jgi:hypothetical protein
MGSNQGKQPHHADRGGKVWSRDEKRENRKVMRAARNRDAIEDSIEGNSFDREDELLDRELDTWCDHELDENGWCPCDDLPRRRPPAKRRRGSSAWCRRKKGRPHDFVFLEKSGLGWFSRYRCTVCGKLKYERTR